MAFPSVREASIAGTVGVTPLPAKIAVCIDGTPEAQHALEMAIALAAAVDAELEIVSVRPHAPRAPVSVVEVDGAHQPDLFDALDRLARDEAEAGGVVATSSSVYRWGLALRKAADRSDLVVLGAGIRMRTRVALRGPYNVLFVGRRRWGHASRAVDGSPST